MSLPINISELIKGKIVEWERLEFKKGWNPEAILHTICAFANDINNWGGGYIIVGIEEKDGMPILPPVGIPMNQLDKIQGEMINICYQMEPNYLPITQPYQIQGKSVLVIKCPAGDLRPYSCPSTQGNDARRQYYIRSGSRSIVAKDNNLARLIELTAKIPFDDRINQQSQINDLDLGLIREFLQEVKSDLFSESASMPFPDLCKAMNITRGPIEAFRPVNAGLMFFNNTPHIFFERAWIELAIHNDNSGRNFISETFKGPLHKQIRNCLSYLKNTVIKSKTVKISGQAESRIISNYPYNALEEAISNAVYHKSYAEGNPIEVQVFPDKIEILSYPGPLPPITNADLQKTRVIARDYRNRRIGDFLKELKLTEGKATGLPLIKGEMKKNGNPSPEFFTDDDRILFQVTLPCNPEFRKTDPSLLNIGFSWGDKSLPKLLPEDAAKIIERDNVLNIIEMILSHDISDNIEFYHDYLSERVALSRHHAGTMPAPSWHQVFSLLDFLRSARSITETMELFEWKDRSKFRKKFIKPFIENGTIKMTIPNNPKHSNQKYVLTGKGKYLLNLLLKSDRKNE